MTSKSSGGWKKEKRQNYIKEAEDHIWRKITLWWSRYMKNVDNREMEE